MPLPGLEKACPGCGGNLHYEDTAEHPDMQGHDVHLYKCFECGPMIHVIQISDEAFLSRWGTKYQAATGEETTC